MKNIKRLVFLFISFLSIQNLQAQITNADTMVHKIFATLKNKDEKAFIALHPNSNQFANMMRFIMEGVMRSDEMQKMMATDKKSKDINIDSVVAAQVVQMTKPEVFSEMMRGISESFKKIIENGEKKNISWQEVTLVNYTVDSVSTDSEDLEMFKNSGIRRMKGNIDFSVGDSLYQVLFYNAFFIPKEGGWFGGEFLQLTRKGEALMNDDIEIKEVILKTVENEPPPPPPPAKSKSKTKTTSSKTKTKTKS